MVGPQPKGAQETLYFCIRQTENRYSMVLWDIKLNCEITCFESSPKSKIIYDHMGSSYVLDNDIVLVSDQCVKLKSFDFQLDEKTESQLAFPINRGCHFDHENHNFLLINDFISLSFSFMTLVIRDKLQMMNKDEGMQQKMDNEMFRFNINKRSFLTCDNFVNLQYEKLEKSLKYLAENDRDMLDLLHYYYTEEVEEVEVSHLPLPTRGNEIREKRVTPLHLAMNNERSANIILNYMSMTDYNASFNIRDILHLCVEKSKFLTYMNELTFQTVEMAHKNTLSIMEA